MQLARYYSAAVSRGETDNANKILERIKDIVFLLNNAQSNSVEYLLTPLVDGYSNKCNNIIQEELNMFEYIINNYIKRKDIHINSLVNSLVCHKLFITLFNSLIANDIKENKLYHIASELYNSHRLGASPKYMKIIFKSMSSVSNDNYARSLIEKNFYYYAIKLIHIEQNRIELLKKYISVSNELGLNKDILNNFLSKLLRSNDIDQNTKQWITSYLNI